MSEWNKNNSRIFRSSPRRNLDKALYFSRRAQVLQKACALNKGPSLPYLSLMQVIYMSPSHWSGQGAHSSWLANWNKLLLGKEVKRKGVAGAFQQKLDQNGVTKISFDTKDYVTFHITQLLFGPNGNIKSDLRYRNETGILI